MNITWPTGLGAVISVIVLIFAVLGLAGVLPASPQTLFALIAALAVARLV